MRGAPSFTDEVKAELANLEILRPCCARSELHALIELLGRRLDGERVLLRLPRNAVARRAVRLCRAANVGVVAVAKGLTEKRPTYWLTLDLPVPRAAGLEECCARALLRGAFVAKGVIGDPANAYHLEMTLPVAFDAELGGRLGQLGLSLGRLERDAAAIRYLKGGEAISRFLGLIGANLAVMRFENGRIVRELRGNANRRANSETANMDKRLRVAVQQLQVVRRLRQADPSLHGLPPALRDAARLRLSRPKASLRELALESNLSKSAMAQRLRRLSQLASRSITVQ
jgi:DNA-binding transcriptional regulator WhiA